MQLKRAACFATLLKSELNSDVARFANHIQTFFATNQIVAGCEKLLQKVESDLHQNLYMLGVIPAYGKLVLKVFRLMKSNCEKIQKKLSIL